MLTFGRVPFAFYVPHFFVAHGIAVLVGLAQGFEAPQTATLFIFYPPGFGLPLAGVYLAWLFLVALLYPFCRWVEAVKARRGDWWLSFV